MAAAVLDRPRGSGYSLWLSSALPARSGTWSLLATSLDRKELDQKRLSLRPVTTGRSLVVVEGQDPPSWPPRL